MWCLITGKPLDRLQSYGDLTLSYNQADTTHSIQILKINDNKYSCKKTWQHHLSTRMHPKLTWQSGWPFVLANRSFPKKEVMSLIFMSGHSGAWSEAPAYVRLPPSQWNGEMGTLSSLMMTFHKRWLPGPWVERLLGCKTERVLLS